MGDVTSIIIHVVGAVTAAIAVLQTPGLVNKWYLERKYKKEVKDLEYEIICGRTPDWCPQKPVFSWALQLGWECVGHEKELRIFARTSQSEVSVQSVMELAEKA